MDLNYQIAREHMLADSADKKILELLSALRGFQQASLTDLSARQLLLAAQQLEITEASARMALSRQTKQGKLIREDGRYTLASSRQTFKLPRFWLDLTRRCHEWQEDWLLINLGNQKYSSTILRRLQRKADLLGLIFIANLGWLRPNNIAELKPEVLFHFNLIIGSDDILVATLSDIAQPQRDKLFANWPIEQLNRFYQQTVIFMQQEIALLDTLDDSDILGRSFAIGRLLVERLSQDPWLPEQVIDFDSRSQLVEMAVDYYQKIKPAWLNVLDQ